MKLKTLVPCFGSRLEKIGVWIVGILAAMFAFFISLTSLLHTTVVDNVKEGEGQDTIICFLI